MSGCAVRGLAFVQDERVTITSPEENAAVTLPFEVAWTVEGFDGTFALFFDRSPMGPNKPLRSLVSRNDPCKSVNTCPDAAWLRDHSIYLTKATTFRVDSLPDLRSNPRAEDRHVLSVVLLDEAGRRDGESVFTREFSVQREAYDQFAPQE
jgi:hypothetical protein